MYGGHLDFCYHHSRKMPPEMLLIFKLGWIFGFLPYTVKDRRLSFKWSSIHTAKFFVVYLMIFSHFVYIVRAVVLDFKNSGLMAALFHGPWLAANISSVICLASLVMNKERIIKAINMISEDWEQWQYADNRKEHDATTKLMWKVHIGWVMMGLGCPVVGLTIMNWTNPMRLVFLSSLFCTSDEDCPEYDVVLSILEQNVAMLYVYFTYYIYDVLPISFSFYAKGSMKEYTGNMIAKIISSSNSCGSMQQSFMKTSRELKSLHVHHRINIIREALIKHESVRKLVEAFNPAVGPFLIVSIVHNFALSITLFFVFVSYISTKNEVVFAILYCLTGCQYLFRTTFLITVFGLVRTEAEHLKETLYFGVDLIGADGIHDLSTLHQVQHFMPLLNDIYMQAGPYISLSHGFLSSFYGVIITYIAILYQSVVMGT